MTKTTFVNRLNKIMTDKSIGRKELALGANVSPAAIGNYVNGTQMPNGEYIAKIVKVLGVSSDYILGLTDVPTPNPTVQGACLATGLSESAVDRLSTATAADTYCIITRLLESNLFYEAIREIERAIECQESSLVKFQSKLTADVLELFGITDIDPDSEINNHANRGNPEFDKAISMLAEMAPNITVLSRQDAAKHHLTEAQYHFRKAIESLI